MNPKQQDSLDATLRKLHAGGLALQQLPNGLFFQLVPRGRFKPHSVLFITSHDRPLASYQAELLLLSQHFNLVVVDVEQALAPNNTAVSCIQAGLALLADQQQKQLWPTTPLSLVVHGSSSYASASFGHECKTLSSILVVEPTPPPPKQPRKVTDYLPPAGVVAPYTVPTYILSTLADQASAEQDVATASVALLMALDKVISPDLCIVGSAAVVGGLGDNMVEFLLAPNPLDVITGTPLEPEEEQAASRAKS